jgi:hypothetical protein
MTLKGYLTLMIFMTLASWGIWFYTVMAINPDITNWIGFLLFYFSLFLALLGTSAIFGFIFRFVALKQELAFRLVKAAFRQSFLFAGLFIIILMLLSRDLFTWMNLSFLILGLSVLEFFLLSYEKSK